MTTQHTPGPWWAEADSRPSDFWGVVYQGKESLKPLALIEHYGGEKTDAANARLIAAAPDLLKALKALLAQLVPFVEDDCVFCHSKRIAHLKTCVYANGEAAITQAEGKE